MLNRSQLSFLALPVLVLSSIASHASTCTIKYKAYPDTTLLDIGTVSSENKEEMKLNAPEHFYRDKGATFAFMFWDVNGSVDFNRKITFSPPTDSDSFVTAWYEETGGGGGGASAVATFAFSLDHDSFISTTPIASVTPSGAWAGGSATSVSTTTAVTIVAKSTMFPDYGKFQFWVELPATTVASATLNVPTGASPWAIAFYKSLPVRTPIPPKCPDPSIPCHF